MAKNTETSNTFWFKSGTKLSAWHAVLFPFTAIAFVCIWIKYMTLMSLSDIKKCNIDFRIHKDSIFLENGHGRNYLGNCCIYNCFPHSTLLYTYTIPGFSHKKTFRLIDQKLLPFNFNHIVQQGYWIHEKNLCYFKWQYFYRHASSQDIIISLTNSLD